jgi:hypothetical protein
MNDPMFTLVGQLVNVYQNPTGVNKDTGEEYGGQDKIQILGNIPLKNGEIRKDLITLTTDQGEQASKLVGRSVTAPVAFYAPSKGNVSFYIPKGFSVAPMAN